MYIMDMLTTVTLHEIHEVLEHFIKRPELDVKSLLGLAAVITNFWIFCRCLGTQRSDLAIRVMLDDIFADLYVSARVLERFVPAYLLRPGDQQEGNADFQPQGLRGQLCNEPRRYRGRRCRKVSKCTG